ncbi:hypothetical protein MKW94_016916 [Papaver nudicaule]|uniref:Surfeit locus protein 2 n=1 Tax=Papaver nudicaule TaxID=74823 RepID=A0AA41SK09_PAPNU|nr:hypothetical protein [Papaver nudicaule]
MEEVEANPNSPKQEVEKEKSKEGLNLLLGFNTMGFDYLNHGLKLICKLTGVTVNKSEEHIWKHINGRKFLNKLEEKETGKVSVNVGKKKEDEEEVETKKRGKKDNKKKRKKKKKGVKEDVPVEKVPEDEDFWMPSPGSRWDFDDGKDRWGSDSESGQDSDEGVQVGNDIEEDEKTGIESPELSMRTKRLSIEVGPSSFASRKKKRKTKSAEPKAD